MCLSIHICVWIRPCYRQTLLYDLHEIAQNALKSIEIQYMTAIVNILRAKPHSSTQQLFVINLNGKMQASLA